MALTESLVGLQLAVRTHCQLFPESYWRELDQQRAYPEAFVHTLTEAGYLGALIPREYGGRGMSLVEASIILEEINRSGGNAGPCHAQNAAPGGGALRPGGTMWTRSQYSEAVGG
jgi:alkylation response protein AidB-like acyl-CoA dehydrogenase